MINANDLARYPVITDNCVTCGKTTGGQPDILNRSGQKEHLDCHAWNPDDFFFQQRLECAPILARDLGRAQDQLERMVALWRGAERAWPRDATAVVRNSWARMLHFREYLERQRLVQALRNF